MSEYDDREGDEYDPSGDGPEARLNRDELEAHLRNERIIDRFLGSLTTEDAHRHLFTWTEMVTWMLKHKRFRQRK